jgi:glycosyltransferase involved in cell wall biosynthesis
LLAHAYFELTASMPHVSVIIPVFNSSHLIGHALRSVFAQTFTDFEVIVVDDGSDDGEALERVLREWGSRIRWIRQANHGPGHARNTGLRLAAGDLVAFLDADDEWMGEKLARQVGYFRQYPETGLLHTRVVGEASPGTAIAGAPRHAFCDLYHTAFFIQTLTVMIPRRVLVEAGGFDERREIHIEDWDLWLRIAARHPIGYLPQPLAVHRKGGWMSRHVERTYTGQLLVMEKSRDLCRQACAAHRAAPAACDRRRRHVLYKDWGCSRKDLGNLQGAREQFRRALAIAPLDFRTALLYLSTFLSARWRSRIRRIRSGAVRLTPFRNRGAGAQTA